MYICINILRFLLWGEHFRYNLVVFIRLVFHARPAGRDESAELLHDSGPEGNELFFATFES
jgi:hypothetical protein